MTIVDYVERAIIAHQIIMVAAVLLLLLGTPAVLLALLRGLSWVIRQIFMDAIKVYKNLKQERLNAAIGLAQLQAAQDSARQALLERRALLKKGQIAGPVLSLVEGPLPASALQGELRLDKNLLQPASPPEGTAELWQDYTRLRLEYRRLQLLMALDQEAGQSESQGLRVT